jgi:signal transduction histidine kinase/ligand-binding sensor domain-containing protein
MPRVTCSGGSAAAQCGEALPHRRQVKQEKEAAPPIVEAQPRRWKSRSTFSVSHKLTALHSGKAATSERRNERKLTPCATLLTAHRSLLTLFCLLGAFYLLPSTFSQNETPSPQAQPIPAPSPSPSPTPPPNLNQWGAVTLFHGLPSDRVHAIAQTPDGVMWFATDGGLAKYDGRRTQAITADGLPPGRVLALKVDDDGALWIGTESGAARFFEGKFEAVRETNAKVITAIITPQKGRAMMATENGLIFDCQTRQEARLSSSTSGPEQGRSITFAVRTIPNQPLASADKDHPGPLKISTLAMVHNTLYAGTQSRGLIALENGEAKEIQSKPRNFFINALETDARGRLWAGTRARAEESGLFDQSEPLKPTKANASTGPVSAIARGAGDEIWVATDGRGAFHLAHAKQEERFSFQGTGGALRSDHVFAIFVDREQVVWFGTDKGVCRYDPHALRAEDITSDPGANYVRALIRTSHGGLLAGTNSGLYLNYASKKTWQAISDVGRRIIYAIGEDKAGRVLVATANGLFASTTNDSTYTRISAPTDKLPQGDSVRAIATVNGVTYIATYGYGVERLQGSQRALVWPDPAADNHLRDITGLGKDANDLLLIGTAGNGVFFFDGKQTITDSALDKLKGDAIWSFAADGPDLWLATGKGLVLLQSGQVKEIAPGVNTRSVVAGAANGNQKYVWCATIGNGVLKVTLDPQFGPIVSRMDVEQGLPSQRAFAVLPGRDDDGTESVIIGTNRGIARYEPGRVPPALAPERIISKRIHTPDELRSGLQLDFPQNSLLLDVSANSSRTFPEQFQYAFGLYDAAGHVIKQKLSHDAQFPIEGLKPGQYKVTARAFTKDLLASEPLSFEFSVAGAPFPWTSTALGVLLILALIALGWGYFQNRRIHRTSAALASANRDLAEARLQLANETEAERRRIARDLHDQTLADLRNLMLMVDQSSASFRSGTRAAGAGGERAAQVPLLNNPGELRSEIESISQEVRRICEDLSPSALENVGLSAALQFALAHAVEHAAPDCKFEYEFVCDDTLDERLGLPSTVQIQIYRMVQEALSNICRHANAKHVKMSANVTDGTLDLQIEDDGRGFERSVAKKNPGRGVANIQARASMIDAEVEWSKRDGGGTVFRLYKEGAGASPLPDLRVNSD